jgi:hypothetical protein
MDGDGSVIIIELKKDRTPREVVAQSIDYASWVAELDDQQMVDIYLNFSRTWLQEDDSLDWAFERKFGIPLKDVTINESHQIVVVATELDSSTERIINYLNEYAHLSINALFFAAFEDGGNQYLSRAWLMDPGETQERAASKSRKEPWNGEFYVSFGDDRPWEEARRWGFISGGGAAWYSKTLGMLSEGDRVWVNIPKTGYVGVGIVTGERERADHYMFETKDGPQRLTESELSEPYPHLDTDADDEHAEYLVPVKWVYTVDRGHAFKEVGLFGHQNTVCKPTAAKWSHTISRLKEVWGVS